MSNYTSDLISVLHADGPASDHVERLGLYGQFVGDWDADIVTYPSDGGRRRAEARSISDGSSKSARSRMSG